MKHPSERHTPRKDIEGKIILEVKVENTCIGLSTAEISSVPFRMSSVPFRMSSLPLLDDDHRENPVRAEGTPATCTIWEHNFYPSDCQRTQAGGTLARDNVIATDPNLER